jgi:hypothetical protein
MAITADNGTRVEDTLRRALSLLWANLSMDGAVSDDQTMKILCGLSRASKVRRIDDTFLGATLRAMRRVVLDDGQTPRQRIGELWRILDVPPVTEALGLDANGRLIAGHRRPAVIRRSRSGRAPVNPSLSISSGRSLPPAVRDIASRQTSAA